MSTAPICRATIAPTSVPFRTFSRGFSSRYPLQASSSVNREKLQKEKLKKRAKKRTTFRQYDLKNAEQFALCDAMRYIRAFEVGRQPTSVKYDCAVKLRTKKDGPVLRNQIRLPYTVKTDIKIAVICPPNSSAAKRAREAGAFLVGEEEVFEVVKSGKFDFDRCIAQPGSLSAIGKAGIARILGPRGLMPSTKLGTLVEDVATSVKTMLGGSMYRERTGVIRMAVGQLGFTPIQLRENVKTFIAAIKKDATNVQEPFTKEIHEIVLSSTNSPGFTLNGDFRSDQSPALEQLST
jgi:large subunit ribosomal protein L1